MEKRSRESGLIVSRRGLLVGLGGTVALAQLPASSARADIVGDAGILLAQLAEAWKIAQSTLATFTQVVNVVKHTYEGAKAAKQALKRAKSGHLDDILNAARVSVGVAGGVIYDLQGLQRTTVFWQKYIQKMNDPDWDKVPYSADAYRSSQRDVRRTQRESILALNKQYLTLSDTAKATDKRLHELSSSAENEDSIVGAVATSAQIQTAVGKQQLAFQHAALEAQIVTANELARQSAEQDYMEQREEEFFGNLDEDYPGGAQELP